MFWYNMCVERMFYFVTNTWMIFLPFVVLKGSC